MLSALTGFFAYRIFRYLKGIKGHLSGRWYGVVYDDKGDIVKYDVYYIRHSGEELYVKGKRLYPKDQTHRKWDFNGVYRDRLVTGYFKSLDSSLNSLGCVLLRNDLTGNVLTGFYLTLYERVAGKGIVSEKIEKIHYQWVQEFDNEFALKHDFKEPSLWQDLKSLFIPQK